MTKNSLINWSVFSILVLINVIHLLFANILFIILRVAFVRNVLFDFMFDIFPIILFFSQVIVSGLLIFIGLYLGKEVGLGAPLLERWANKEGIHERVVSILKISLGFGIIVAGAKFLLDRFVFSAFVPSLLMQWKQIPLGFIWLVPFNQGIGDEKLFHCPP